MDGISHCGKTQLGRMSRDTLGISRWERFEDMGRHTVGTLTVRKLGRRGYSWYP